MNQNEYRDLVELINRKEVSAVNSYVLEHNVNVEKSCHNDFLSPLNYVIKKGDLAILKLFLKLNPDLDKKSCDATPLLMASKRKPSKKTIFITKLLLSHGADVNIEDSNKQSPLYFAVLNRNKDLVTLLLANNSKTEVGYSDANYGINGVPYYTPLYLAVVYNYFEIVAILLKHGANPNTGIKGKNFLSIALKKKSRFLAKLLLRAKASTKKEFISTDTKIRIRQLITNKTICISLRSALSSPKKVTYLDLQGLGLNSIPKEIKRFSNLRVLNLGHNVITNLDFNFALLEHLEILILNRNPFKKIEAVAFEGLQKSNLKFLDLRGTYLQKTLFKVLGRSLDDTIIFENDAVYYKYSDELVALDSILANNKLNDDAKQLRVQLSTIA